MKQWMGTSQQAGEKLGPREQGGGLERGERASDSQVYVWHLLGQKQE